MAALADAVASPALPAAALLRQLLLLRRCWCWLLAGEWCGTSAAQLPSCLRAAGDSCTHRHFPALCLCPTPQVYLSTLELSKSVTNSMLHRFDLGDTAAVGAASFVGGAMASLSSQMIVVPIDVVAQRLMIMGGGPPPGADPNARAAAAAEAAARHHTSGLALARSIVAAEGVRGLYRGFGASLAMFVPNSAIW